jgi:threonine dehydratase
MSELPAPTVSLREIENARPIAMEVALRTPLARVLDTDLHLKLENLQPIGSFKLRGAHCQIQALRPKAVVTASAGNFAQGAAYCARRLGIPCSVVVPEWAAPGKVEAIEKLGARVVRATQEVWWNTFVRRSYPGIDATYVSAFDHPAMIAGNGTIGLEIVEDLRDVDTVLVPWGGGGLACGVAIAVRALRPSAKVFAVEASTSAPLSAAWAAGKPVEVEGSPSFIDGIGAPTVFPHMYALARAVLSGVMTATEDETKEAVRFLVSRARVVAEGAGAVSVAVGRRLTGKVACVVSGGNIDRDVLVKILRT